MRLSTRLLQSLQTLRASYWFVPSIMALLAIVLGAVTVWLDAGPAAGLFDDLGWYQTAKPDGAHQVLSTIAGSMITVAGVVFSITIVAIAYAASQYGPRILTNFMSDRGNQVTLGTFIATFVYCLVVLRTIRGGDDGGFVPQLAVMVGMLLALCSIGVLIFFIHHVPNSIQINNVVGHIGRKLVHAVETRFPEQIGDPGGEPNEAAEYALARGFGVATVCAASNGYIQAIDEGALMHVATKCDLVLRVDRRPGQFVFEKAPLLTAYPEASVGEEAREGIAASYSIGNNRAPSQDIFFLVDELVEIAARALSSGVNDPYTAITCMDWLGAALARIAARPIKSGRRSDHDNAVRVIAVPHGFPDFVERGFGRLRQYLATDMNATAHALETLTAIARHSRSPDRARVIEDERQRLLAAAERELTGPSLVHVKAFSRDLDEGRS